MPLADNNNEHDYGYEVHVFTGIKSNAGTKSKVSFILAGTETDSGIRLLDDKQRKVKIIELFHWIISQLTPCHWAFLCNVTSIKKCSILKILSFY